MKKLIHIVLIFISLLILGWGAMMLRANGPWLISAVGLITLGCAIANGLILWGSMKGGDESRGTLLKSSVAVNTLLFLTWLGTSLDSGGLQQFEGPVVLFLAAFGVANWYLIRRGSRGDRSGL